MVYGVSPYVYSYSRGSLCSSASSPNQSPRVYLQAIYMSETSLGKSRSCGDLTTGYLFTSPTPSTETKAVPCSRIYIASPWSHKQSLRNIMEIKLQ